MRAGVAIATRGFEAFLDSCGWSLIGGPEVDQSSDGVWSWRYEVDLASEGATYSLIGLLRVWMSGPAGRTVLIEHDTVFNTDLANEPT
jgi:hypothetical protein